MKRIEKSAKTVEEAIEQGLQELGVSIGDVDVQVLEEGSKGLFGLFGSRLAKVSLTVKEEEEDLLEDLMGGEKKPRARGSRKPEGGEEAGAREEAAKAPAGKKRRSPGEAERKREAEKKEAARPAPVKRVAVKKADRKPAREAEQETKAGETAEDAAETEEKKQEIRWRSRRSR